MAESSASGFSKPPVSRVLVTGGAGFIGANFLNLLVPRFPEVEFTNLDALTYAGNLASLALLEPLPNYRFVQLDLVEAEAVSQAVEAAKPDWIFHFAAETHVDRSIRDPERTVQTNVLGTLHLLEAARNLKDFGLFLHVSTDEVFGSLGHDGFFSEETSYDPSSPYSASKAGADHLVRAYGRTFRLPTLVTNCSNNYGPFQFPEKLMPVMVLAARDGRPLPVYGDGSNVRDWLFVEDHVRALWELACRGRRGETYCIGGRNERSNLEIVHLIAAAVARRIGKPEAEILKQIEFVTDRPGHDWRYAIDASKLERELDWRPTETVETGVERTVDWYLANGDWVQQVQSGAYRTWMREHYGEVHA
jgi:dTDP-glucose 4,6-dehydratase